MSDKREWTAERHAAAKDLGSLSGAGKRDALAEIERLAKVLGDAHAALDVEIGRGDKATGRVFTLAERIGFVLSGLREETRRADDAEDKVARQAREIERLSLSEAACVREALEQVGTARAERDEWKAQASANAHGCEEQKAFREAAETERDAAQAEVERLKADLLLLGALKSAEVAPVIERFRAAFGADVPQAPSGKRATAEAERDDARRLVTLERRVGRWMSTEDEEALRRLRQEAREWDGSKVDPPVRRARHDRHCLIHDGGGCSREPGCEVEP